MKLYLIWIRVLNKCFGQNLLLFVMIGLLSCTLKCRLSQVIKSRKSEVDPQGIDEEKLFEVKDLSQKLKW